MKWSESHSVMSDSLQHHRLYSPWNSPGKNTGVGSLSLLQEIFPTQGSNPGLLQYRWILYQLSHKGSPRILEWVSCLSLLQLIFPTQESNWCLLHCRQILYQLSYQGCILCLLPINTSITWLKATSFTFHNTHHIVLQNFFLSVTLTELPEIRGIIHKCLILLYTLQSLTHSRCIMRMY